MHEQEIQAAVHGTTSAKRTGPVVRGQEVSRILKGNVCAKDVTAKSPTKMAPFEAIQVEAP